MLAWNTRWKKGSFVFNIADLIVVQWVGNKHALRGWRDAVCKKARCDTDLATMVECLVEELAAVGLSLNVSKTKILTIENLNGPMFLDIGDYIIKFYMGGKIKKYLGKKLFGDLRKRALVGLQHRSQIVWMRFEEHRDTLLNRHVCLRPRLKLFDSVISPTILFSLLTCPLASNQLQKLEIVRNRMLGSIVGWAPLADNVWHALMQKMSRKLENAQPVSTLDHGLRDCWLEDFVLQRRLHLQCIPGPPPRVNGIPAKGGQWIIV